MLRVKGGSVGRVFSRRFGVVLGLEVYLEP